MRILDVLLESAIIIDLVSEDKVGVLNELVVPVARIAGVKEIDFFNVLMEREKLGSTGIGGGIGIPHCKFSGLRNIIMGFGLSHKGVEFESVDGKLVHIFFLLITPDEYVSSHLNLLARLSRMLSKEYIKNMISNVESGKELLEIIKENDHDF